MWLILYIVASLTTNLIDSSRRRPNKYCPSIESFIDEQGDAISKMLSHDDVYMLWAVPIFKAQNDKVHLLSQAEKLSDDGQVCLKISSLN